MEETIIEAKKRKLSYIYQNSKPDFIDSLAYSNGLRIINLDTIDDYDKSSLSKVKSKTMEILIGSIQRENYIITVDISKIDVDDFIAFARGLRKKGTNLLNIKGLNRAPEFIVEDL